MILTVPIRLGRGALIIRQGWGKTWDIPLDENEPRDSKKLLRWIEEYPERGSDVQEILYAISNIFADIGNLEKKYGVVIKKKSAVSHGFNPILGTGINL